MNTNKPVRSRAESVLVTRTGTMVKYHGEIPGKLATGLGTLKRSQGATGSQLTVRDQSDVVKGTTKGHVTDESDILKCMAIKRNAKSNLKTDNKDIIQPVNEEYQEIIKQIMEKSFILGSPAPKFATL